MNESQYRKKLDHIFTMLEKRGYKEHFPPSQHRWHYKRGHHFVTVNFKTCRSEAGYYPES